MADDSTTYGSFYPFIDGLHFPVEDDFSQTLAAPDYRYSDACIDRLLIEDYHTPPAAIDTTHSEFHQSTADFGYGDLPSERPTAVTINSAFSAYKRESLSFGQQSAHEKQKLLKRCLDFVGKMRKSSKLGSSWDNSANARMVEESYAYTHMMSERKRRNTLNQQFKELRSLLPQNSKGDKHSILSETILQLNHLKLRKKDLEQKNKALVDMYTRSISEGYIYSSSSLDGGSGLSGGEASTTDVVFESSNIPDEDNIQVTLTKNKASTHTDVITSLLKCLRELKVEVVRIQWRNPESVPQVVQATICTRTKGKGWQISQQKYVEEAVKRAVQSV